MGHFATHTLIAFLLECCFLLGEVPIELRAFSDSLNNITRQNRTKIKENLESIARAECQCFVLHSNRAAF